MSFCSPIECTCFTRVIVIVMSLAPSELFFYGVLNLLLQTLIWFLEVNHMTDKPLARN